MPTINTVEDLIAVLDDKPEWVDALRARLLTRELLELPERFAAFAAATNERLDALEELAAVANKRLDAIEKLVAVAGERLDAIEKLVAVADERLDAIEETAAATNKRLDALQNDVGILKGAHARNVAIEEATTIAREMGMRRTKNLTQDDLWDMIDSTDTTGIPTNELRSFRRADLILEATDSKGATCYIAVEISFTANGRDTSRACRNARFLTQFTDKSAYAAVAGLRRDDRIQEAINSGEVFWYQLAPEALEAE